VRRDTKVRVIVWKGRGLHRRNYREENIILDGKEKVKAEFDEVFSGYQLTRLIARENFIILNRRESNKSQRQSCLCV